MANRIREDLGEGMDTIRLWCTSPHGDRMATGHNAEVALIGHKLLNNLAKYKLFTQQFDPFTGIQAEDEDADGEDAMDNK